MPVDFFESYQIDDDLIAVAVSGGADSLALVLRLKDRGKNVVALTVDHGLRKESREEALYVAKLMRDAGIEHHILTWEGEKPLSDIEAVARENRYKLLFEWCHQQGVKTLAVGHHRRDQAETFLLRLQRGSGLDGLCCMQPVSEREGIRIIRPQLNDSPDDLRKYLQERQIEWVEDSSNQCDDFLRVKIRKFLPELEARLGLSEARLAETAAVLARSRSYLEAQTEKLLKNHVRFFENAAVSLSPSLVREQHPEIAYRLFAKLIVMIGGQPYAPESEETLRLVEQIDEPDFRGATLGACEIIKAQKRLWIVPEVRSAQVLSVLEWEKCLQNLPQYAKANLPYKVRRAIFNQQKKNNNGKK